MYLFQIFDKVGFLYMIFPSDFICHQLRAAFSLQIQSADLKGDNQIGDAGFVLGLIVASLEFIFQKLLDQQVV